MKNVVVIAGGNSSEYVVSIKSGSYVYEMIDETRYNKYLMLIERAGLACGDRREELSRG